VDLLPELGMIAVNRETMTKRSGRNHNPAFKAKVALAAVRGEKTLTDPASSLKLFKGAWATAAQGSLPTFTATYSQQKVTRHLPPQRRCYSPSPMQHKCSWPGYLIEPNGVAL
jgi:hypothetical protein